MDNYGKIKQLKADREQKQKAWLAIGYIVLVVLCSGWTDNFIAGTIIATFGCAFFASAVLGGIGVYNAAAEKEDCKKYLTEETYNKMMRADAEYRAQKAKEEKATGLNLSPATKTAAKAAAAGYAGYKIGKGIAKW